MKQAMINDIGQVKIVKSGFSWTVFFFGWLVPLFRGDLKWFAIMLLLNIISTIIAAFIFLPISILVQLGFSFFYNQLYIEDLLKQGYKFQNSNNNQ